MTIKLNWLLLACLIPASAMSAEVFRWVDKDGQVHFGDRPPAGEKATREQLTVSKGAKVAGSTATGSSRVEQELAFRKRRAERQEQEKKQEDATRLNAKKAEQCNKMRASLTDMESGMRLYDYDASGQRYLLNEEQHGKATAGLRQQIARDCK